MIFLSCFVVGLIAGVIAAISGGGGLLLMPFLLFAGLPPVQAIATQDLFAVPAQAAAALYFARRGHLPARAVKMIPILIVCGALGAFLVSRLPTDLLKVLVPVFLLLLSGWALFNPGLKVHSSFKGISERAYRRGVVPILGVYDGFFGVSSTTFYALSYMNLLKTDIIEATAAAKLFTLCSSSAAMIYFTIQGDVNWYVGIFLALGGVIGARIGARLVIKHGTSLVRWFVVVTAAGASIKLIADQIAGMAS